MRRPSSATDINYNIDRKADISVPGAGGSSENVGILNSNEDQAAEPALPAPGGFGNKGREEAHIESIVSNTNLHAGEGRATQSPRHAAGQHLLRLDRSTPARRLPCVKGQHRSFQAAVAVACDSSPASDRPAVARTRRQIPRQGQREQRRHGTRSGLLPFLAAGRAHRGGQGQPVRQADRQGDQVPLRRHPGRRPAPLRSRHVRGICTIAICRSVRPQPGLPSSRQKAIHSTSSALSAAAGISAGPSGRHVRLRHSGS